MPVRAVKTVTLLGSSSIAATTKTGSWENVEEYSEGLAYLDVTSISGSGKVTIKIQGSHNQSAAHLLYTMTTASAVSQPAPQALTNFGPYIRAQASVVTSDVTCAVVASFKT